MPRILKGRKVGSCDLSRGLGYSREHRRGNNFGNLDHRSCTLVAPSPAKPSTRHCEGPLQFEMRAPPMEISLALPMLIVIRNLHLCTLIIFRS
ncbi:hypothetical protein CEXT_302281 [Caerostris extrusa]|uniref:Uncharacterized protein n=1 Tax=Caerostris extrusa TaxID=172846 RepID=A0AAV4U9W1_CAEEX|nr:hypothetical protein CEXT_302281 [Caerostris extrusa]